MGLTADINLSDSTIEISETPADIFRKYLGSRGYAARILYDRVGPEVEPFSGDNLLIFSTGLFTGTHWPTGARLTVTAKSPLTGSYGYSNTGGFFGAELRKAGFDALIVRGESPGPIYLMIEDNRIRIEDAGEYWGKTTDLVTDSLREKHPGSRVAAIGPAGENLVRVAAIINDGGRAAGRCGMGAVMGSKKLKAVVVIASGNVSYPDEFKKVAIRMAKKVATNPASILYRKFGTSILVEFKNPRGDLPGKNHQEVQFPAVEKINARALDKYVYKNSGCYSCPIRCARNSRVESGPYQCETEGPEYETIDSFGPMIWNDDMELIIYANKLCNNFGIDTISTGVILAFAMECHQRGYLDDDELSLEWGDKKSILGLLEMIVYRRGIGDILAEGVRRASEKFHPETKKFALHVKGMESARQEPRTNRGLALGHATSNRGADHLYGLCTIDQTHNREAADLFFPGSTDEILDVFSQKYKPEMINLAEAYSAVSDALGICKFSTLENYALMPDDLAEGLNALDPSFHFDGESLLRVGERIVNLERMYNYRHGLRRKDDLLPERFTKEPVSLRKEVDGVLTDEIYIKDLVVDIDEMLDGYYALRGWDEDGVPTVAKLKELGLEDLVEDLVGVKL